MVQCRAAVPSRIAPPRAPRQFSRGNLTLQENLVASNEISTELISSNNNDREDYGLRSRCTSRRVERDFLSEAKRNGKAFPRIFQFTVTRGRNSREFIGVVRVEESASA